MTTQREIAESLGLPIHPPKIELFDLGVKTNTDSKQRVRDVDEYRVEPFGLYLARPIANHPRLTYMQSWLLPDLGIRVTDWERQPGQKRDLDFYLDIVEIQPGPIEWRTTDLYLDIAVHNQSAANILDVDEFLTAVRADLLTPETAQRAMETAYSTLDGLAAHGYDLRSWLLQHGIELSWKTIQRSA